MHHAHHVHHAHHALRNTQLVPLVFPTIALAVH
jgi:hypothetical protein